MADEILLLPHEASLDPLDPASLRAWVERHGRRKRPPPVSQARALANLLHRLWPGLRETKGDGELLLSDPDEAPLSIAVAEKYARISILREPRDGEPAFAETIGRALSSETGWIGYDPRREEIVLGMRWHCAACNYDFGVQHMACPACATAPARGSHVFAEPEPLFDDEPWSPMLELLPLLWHYGLGADDLTDELVSRIEEALAGGLRATGIRTPLEVMVERDRSGAEVFQVVKVVESVDDPASQVAVDSEPAKYADADVDDDLLFQLYVTAADQPMIRSTDEAMHAQLPLAVRQPDLAGPLWAALRPLLATVDSAN